MRANNIKTISILIASALLGSSVYASGFDLDASLRYPPKQESTKTGPLEGTRPYIEHIKALGEQSANAGDTFSLFFDDKEFYVYKDEDEDKDISKNSFAWYCFSEPDALLTDLKKGYPNDPDEYLESLIISGKAISMANPLYGEITESETENTLTLIQSCQGGIGFTITATSYSGYPIPDRVNNTIIVPFVDMDVSQDKDGNIDYGTKPGGSTPSPGSQIVFELADGSSYMRAVPPRDMNGRKNINDGITKAAAWLSTISYAAKAADPKNPDQYLDISADTPNWTVSIIESGTVKETFSIQDEDRMDFYQLKLKSVPAYNEAAQGWQIELASNLPIEGEINVSFTSETFKQDARTAKLPFKFYDHPSEKVQLKIYKVDPLSARKAINPLSEFEKILPNHRYELEIIDPENLNEFNQPSVVTNYFTPYIRWSLGTVIDDDTSTEIIPIDIKGCNGTYQFPTQIDNQTRVAKEINEYSRAILPNYEQGMKLIATLELDPEILSGNKVLTAVPKTDMPTCSQEAKTTGISKSEI